MASNSCVPSSSSSSSPAHQFLWEVFLSFNGEDTREKFVDHLYTALYNKGIPTFKDDEKLEKGRSIGPELDKAIKESRYYIVVLSENYASSRWCLDELLHIRDSCSSKNDSKGRRHSNIYPVFYHLDPSNVRHQDGPFGEGFAKAASNHGEAKVQMWREALKEVADLSGWVYPSNQYRFESKFIEELVSKICSEGEGIYANVTGDLVGIHSRVEKVIQLLGLGLDDHARAVGIWGMGGVGKTTIAREVFCQIYYQFDAVSYLENVREVSTRSGLATLQQQLISDTLGLKDLVIRDTVTGDKMIRNRVCNKKVLIVLDDVDQVEQLENLVGTLDRFNVGSRIIITTRDKHLLTKYNVKDIYEVEMLDEDKSIKLFISKAFGNEEQQTKDFEDLVKRAAKYAGGVPLALVVLGSLLKGRGVLEWESALNRLKDWPDEKVLRTLEISYDSLQPAEKQIFLDIACFLKGENITLAKQILNACGFYAEIGINILVDKSLISFENNRVWIHDLIQELGWDIVRQESRDLGGRSRLWLDEDVRSVLVNNTGTNAVECIVLRPSLKKELLNLGAKAFAKMTRLRLLKICNVQLPNGLKYLSNELRYLDWDGYPLKCFPQTFRPEHLVKLHLINSPLEQLWDGKVLLPHLRITKFCNLTNLKKCPDFTAAPKLEKLAIVNCESLVDVHHSVGVLTKLDRLDIVGCRNIRSLPTCVGCKSLVYLELLGDEKRKFRGNIEWDDDLTREWGYIGTKSSDLGADNRLEYLDDDMSYVEKTNTSTKAEAKAEKELSNMGAKAFAKMTGLKFLKICIVQLPNCITYLPNELMYLNWDGYPLKCFPKTFRPEHLVELRLSNSSIEQLWDGKLPLPNLRKMTLMNLTNLTNCPDVTGAPELQKLVIQDCESLVDVHQSVGDLTKLEWLYVTGCRNLRSLPTSMDCKSLRTLEISEDPIPSGRPKRINIPEFFENMKSLTELGLELTGMIELPLSVRHLKILNYLDLSHCRNLRSLPDSICQLKALHDLDLSDCQNLRSLPDSICQLKALRFLRLNNCRNLRSLPDSICQLKALSSLLLGNCKNLRSLPDSFCQLKALETLNLSWCSNLEKLPSSSGAHLMELRTLYMSGCKKITSDSLNSFFSFSISRESLRFLNMKECNLKSVPAAICSLCSLAFLILDGNDFERLPAGMNQLTRLKTLFLRGCKRLEELPEFSTGLEKIYASDCQSLRTVLSPSKYVYLHEFDLSNCIRMLGNEQRLDVLLSTVSQFYRRTDHNHSPTTEIRFPGSEIPKWFSRDKVELQLTNGRSLRYATCAVVEIEETYKHSRALFSFTAALLNIGDRLFNDLHSSATQWRPTDTETLWIKFGVLRLSKDELDRLNELGGPEFVTFRIKSTRPGFKIKSCGLRLWIQEVNFIDPYNDDFDTASMRERKRLYNVDDDDDDDPVEAKVDSDWERDLVGAPPRNLGNNKKLRQLFEPKAMDLDLNEEETVGVVTASIPKRRCLDNVDDDDDEEEEERHPNNKKPRQLFEPKAMDLDLNEEETIGPSRNRSLEEKEEDPSMDPQPRI